MQGYHKVLNNLVPLRYVGCERVCLVGKKESAAGEGCGCGGCGCCSTGGSGEREKESSSQVRSKQARQRKKKKNISVARKKKLCPRAKVDEKKLNMLCA